MFFFFLLERSAFKGPHQKPLFGETQEKGKIIKERSTDERIGKESVSLTQQTAFDWRLQRVEEEEEEGGREADGKELIHYASN